MRAELASGNPHKLLELAAALPGWEIGLLQPAGDYPEETGDTYYANARGKARFGRGHAAPGVLVLGEDSGLEVAGLGWGPGVLTARFGAGDPVGRILEALAGTAGEARRARYVCELVGILPGGEEVRGSGVLAGSIGSEGRGSEGFGYDPVFVPDGESGTVAELGDAWKVTRSHRALAALDLAAALSRR